MYTILLLLKSSMLGVHLKLVKDIPRLFQNSDFVCGGLFDILRSVRLHKIFCNHKDGWGLHTTLDMKCATTLRHRIKIQSTSSDQSYRIYADTFIHTRSSPMKT